MKTVLAYRFSAFGDVAMIVPVFRELLEQNPDLHIIMVSRSNFKDLFEDLPNLTFKGIKIDDYPGIIGLKKLYSEIYNEFRPDFVADLHDVIRTKMLDAVYQITGKPVFKIDKGKEDKEHLTDVWNLEKHQLKHNTERYAEVFRQMGFKIKLSGKYRPQDLEKNGVGFAPFAQHKGKMMPLEKSFRLAQIISEIHPLFLYGGGKEENEILSHWQSQLTNTISYAGRLSLKEELQTIARLQVMISMDSANMHLASLMGTRCISIWGSTHPFAGFLGYGQNEEDVVQVQDLTCRPCSVFGDKPCYRGDYACLEELDISKIISRIKL